MNDLRKHHVYLDSKSGFYYIYVKFANQPPIRRSAGTKSIREADLFLARFLETLKNPAPVPSPVAATSGNVGNAGRIRVVDFKAKYFELKQANRITTLEIRSLHWQGFFERGLVKVFLDEYTSSEVKAYFAGRAAQVRPATHNSELRTVKNVFNEAVECEYLMQSPAAKVHTLKEPKKRIHKLDNEERIKILKACKEHCPEYLAGVAILIYTGMRHNELDKLEWQDLDLENRTVSVRRKGGDSLQGKSNASEATFQPKTEASNRTIYLPLNLVELLKPLAQSKGFVLPAKKAKVGRIKRYRSGLYDVLKDVIGKHTGVSLNPHAFRHNHVTRLDNCGVLSDEQIRTWTGHADKATFDSYSHPDVANPRLDEVIDDDLSELVDDDPTS